MLSWFHGDPPGVWFHGDPPGVWPARADQPPARIGRWGRSPATKAGISGRMKTELQNVRVFDGRHLRPPGTVVLDGGRIGSDTSGAQVIDGAGAVLLPGLTDAHLHLDGRAALERLVRFGITTALDMCCVPPELVESLREIRGSPTSAAPARQRSRRAASTRTSRASTAA